MCLITFCWRSWTCQGPMGCPWVCCPIYNIYSKLIIQIQTVLTAMMRIASEPISKVFVAPIFSRSFCISFLCYILILIIPALILINISYFWPEYKRTLLVPAFTYQGYQLSCLNSIGVAAYSTNLPSGFIPASASTVPGRVGAGIQNNVITIEGQVFASGLVACSAQLFFNTKLGSSVQALINLPLNFHVSGQSLYLSSATVRGTISVKQSQPISQSYLFAVNQTQLGIYPYSFASIFRDSGSKITTLDSKVLYSKVDYRTSSTQSFSFGGEFQVVGEVYKQQASLIQKLRVFIPIFMYLCLFMWWVVVNPLIDWMLTNRVYSAKQMGEKVKRQ